MASIDMSWYIYELVSYLWESFTVDGRIDYNLDTEAVDLDVTQAVPLGQILNEAVSNAIKYAFTNRERGKLDITLRDTGADTFQLTIADDGVGMPKGFESLERESLGIDLIIGLTNQLDGSLELKNSNGLTVMVTFIWKEPWR